MKKSVFFLLFMALGLASAFSQTSNDSIYTEKVVGGHKYIKSGISLTWNQLCDVLGDDPDIRQEVKKAKVNQGFGEAFAYVGGFCVGFSIGNMIFNGADKVNLILGGAGIGITVAAFALSSAADKHMMNATSIYNKNLGKTASGDVSLNFGLTQSGVGLTLSF